MPELPEVETVVRTLRPILIGSTIESMTFRYAKMIHPSPSIFEQKLKGQTFTNIERIGKFIIFFFPINRWWSPIYEWKVSSLNLKIP